MHFMDFIRYTIRHAPWAVISSLSAGLSNYVIIILLAEYYGLAEGGEFRLLLSIVGLLTLLTLNESDKVAIRHLVMGKTGVIRPLIAYRMKFAAIGVLIGLATAYVFYRQGHDIWVGIAVASLLLPFTWPLELYNQILQSRNRFRRLAAMNAVKYGILTAIAVIAGLWSISVLTFVVVYFAVFTLINAIFTGLQREAFQPASPQAPLLRRESLQLSFAGIFPIILEHADKILVSYFLGLEKLAIYTIGVSTGRLISIIIKPTMTVYFPILVKDRFSGRLLWLLFLLLTIAGLFALWPLYYYFNGILGSEYAEAYLLAAVIIAGLGIHFISVAVYYSSVYYKEARLSVPTMTSFLSTAITLTYLLFALSFGGPYALILAAALYPLRDLITLIATLLLTRKVQPA
jgi:O-antigen/teichoic acid export membrane protein